MFSVSYGCLKTCSWNLQATSPFKIPLGKNSKIPYSKPKSSILTHLKLESWVTSLVKVVWEGLRNAHKKAHTRTRTHTCARMHARQVARWFWPPVFWQLSHHHKKVVEAWHLYWIPFSVTTLGIHKYTDIQWFPHWITPALCSKVQMKQIMFSHV